MFVKFITAVKQGVCPLAGLCKNVQSSFHKLLRRDRYLDEEQKL